VIYLTYLNGYAPRWADPFVEGVADAVPCPIETRAIELDLESCYALDRNQYHATLLLASLLRHLPNPSAKILGVTPVDLFVPVLTFVFGQSQLDGPGAIVSTYRLHNEFYGLRPNEGLLVERAIKEAVHELGHAFGLLHCSNYQCVMHASTHVEEVDIKQSAFCDACRPVLAGVNIAW